MTTRKQRREAGQIKFEHDLADSIESGLRAQARDRQRREARARDAAQAKHDKKHSLENIEQDCILCQDRLINYRKEQQEMEDSVPWQIKFSSQSFVSYQ